MPLRKHKPTSPGRRFATYADFAELTRDEPEKSLTNGLKKSGGRNVNGRKTSRHRGGGAKRLYRKIDFKRRKDGVPAKVAHIEYDPNRSAYIALLHYADGEKRYILAPQRLRVGATVESGTNVDIRVGNSLPLQNMPAGTVVHNVELVPGRGGQMARAAGAGVQLLAKEGVDYLHLALGEAIRQCRFRGLCAGQPRLRQQDTRLLRPVRHAQLFVGRDRGFEQGARTLSFGLIYLPGMFAATEELDHLAREAARAQQQISRQPCLEKLTELPERCKVSWLLRSNRSRVAQN